MINRTILWVLCPALAAFELHCAAEEKGISVEWHGGAGSNWNVEVRGLGEPTLELLRRTDWDMSRWQRLFPVHVDEGNFLELAGLPPMLGEYRIGESRLVFAPKFPLDPDLSYRATLWPEHLPGKGVTVKKPITARLKTPPRPATPETVVTEVYPSAKVVPENLLKFYVHFSAPMRRGHIYEHIHLRTEAGKLVELPFLELDEELWNPEMTRVTLFIDPGRIKRGVTPLEEVGPALEAGKRFTLVIDREWRDYAGRPLKASHEKSFQVGPADREPPDQTEWKVEPPRAGSAAPLSIQFPEPMDHALSQRMIQVVTKEGGPVDGTTELKEQEREWRFSPARPWNSGRYKILVQTTIEDLAGNNIGKRFEVDTFEGIQRRFTNATVSLPFEISSR